ncbi:MAG: CHAT domain-containing protein [Gammaproteobacteria bacterium]|nr:CHAT domain-containing protein [Gammaproteobacteria bacterium]
MAKMTPFADALARATQCYFGGDIAGAVEIANEARNLATSNTERATVLVQKAAWLREIGRREDAAAALEGAEDEYESVDAMPDFIRASLSLEKGIVASHGGDFAHAIALLLNAKKLGEGKNWGALLVPDALANLAGVYLQAGEYEKAQTAASDALDADRAINNTRAVANDLNLLGLVAGARGDHNVASGYFREAMSIAVSGGFLQQIADAAYNQATQLDQIGKHDQAAAILEDLREAYEVLGSPRGQAGLASSLGIADMRTGDASSGKARMVEALEGHRRSGDDVHVVFDLINLATIEMEMKNHEAAVEYARQAKEQAEALSLVEVQWAALSVYARALVARLAGAPDADAAPAPLSESLAAYGAAADAIELLRTGIGRPEERQRLLWNKEHVYSEGAFLAASGGQGVAAFEFSERARSRSFLDGMSASRIKRTSARNIHTARREELIEEYQKASSPEERSKLLTELRVTRAKAIAEAPRIAAVTETELANVDEIAALLPEGTGIVEFYLLGGQNLMIIVLSNKGLAGLTVLTLGKFDLPCEIKRLRAEIAFPPRVSEARLEPPPSAYMLFTILFGNIFNLLEDFEHLIIVPHKELHYLPFAALWFKNSGEGPPKLYLGQRFYLSILPSAASLPLFLSLERPSDVSGASLVLGNPTTDLHGAENEAVRVARHLGVEPLLRERAVRSALISADKQHGIIHVASHGVHDDQDPLLSGLVMSDGLFTVDDLLASDLPTSLLSLSGCVTGLTARHPGDELVGLSRAAALAGAPSVLTTLWETSDQSGPAFFDAFYTALLSGASKVQALTHAQHTMREQYDYSQPLHWAPYVLMGDWC